MDNAIFIACGMGVWCGMALNADTGVNQMELKDLTSKTLSIFGVTKSQELGNALMDACLSYDEAKFDEFLEITDEDLETDYLQKIFQYYCADRKNLGQDYTPPSLACLVNSLTEGSHNRCIDVCAGSGALTIQQWVKDRQATFICQEFDERVIPFLLFNLVIRNINGKVQQMDVLADEVYHEYRLSPQEKYSKVEVIK